MSSSATTALGVFAALVSVVFALSTWERWLLRRAPQHAIWAVAMGVFAIGAAALAYGSAAGWSGTTFRVFYAAGAVGNVPLLACGQLYLVLSRRSAERVSAIVALLCAFAVGVVLSAPLHAPVPSQRLPQGDEVFGLWPRVFAAVGSGLGATVLLVGTVLAIVGIVRANRRTPFPGARRRIVGLVLLAVGTLVLGASGLLNSLLGAMGAFAVTLTAGITILFAGFVLSSSPVGTTVADRVRMSPGTMPET